MHILVAAVVILAFWSTEMTSKDVAPSTLQSLTLVIGSSCLLFWLSWFISLLVRKQVSRDRLRKAEWGFIATWLVGNLLNFGLGRWGNVVRENWNLNRWFLFDEIAILVPVLVPLVVHWWCQSVGEKPERLPVKKRIQFVGLRVQVYFALTLVPMLFIWAANDLSQMFPLDAHPAWKWTLLFLAFAGATIFFPIFLIWIWPNKELSDPELRARIQNIFQEKKIKISQIRVWQTDNQVTNAMVAGFFWPCRTLWISDGLMSLLTASELDAVIRHEAAHVSRRHLPIRFGVLLLPILVVGLFIFLFPGQLQTWIYRLGDLGLEANWISWVLLPSFGFCYLTWALNWVSYHIEKDADIEACLISSQYSSLEILDVERVSHFKSALQKIAVQMPGGVRKRTFLHPSILDRATFLSEMIERPQRVREFRKHFVQNMVLLALIAVALGTSFALI